MTKSLTMFATSGTSGAPSRPSLAKVPGSENDPHGSRGLPLWPLQFEVEVQHAHFGMQGFSLTVAERPDVIVTDLPMPQGEGDQVGLEVN